MVAVGLGGLRSMFGKATPFGTSLMGTRWTLGLQAFVWLERREGHVSWMTGLTMAAQSVEEHLQELAAIVDEAERLGIDPWPPDKPERPWARWALGSFMIVLMLSAVSKVFFRFAEI